ncbi:MAG: hypothetical protein EOP53_13400 [Sphingobacteriales bacterium]|nr:MAG: hypothetical protein EOP53_13400 [Sphingobacteriales bacterium]
MKWIYCIRPKHKAALILAAVFVIILGNNILSKQNINTISSSFSSVYEDRLLVESYIFKLSDLLYRKKITLDKIQSPQELRNQQHILNEYTAEIDILLTDYEKTRFTPEEAIAFKNLKDKIIAIERLEKFLADATSFEKAKYILDEKFNAASANLARLSQIQVSEGKLLNDESKKSIAGFTLLTQFETGILVFLGLVIQALLLASGSLISKPQQKHSLN